MAGNKQQVRVPPVENPVAQQVHQGEAARQFLLKAGWIEQSVDDEGKSQWLDPAGQSGNAGASKKSVELPGKDGADPTVISQVSCPPVAWAYGTSEACNIQRLRDRAAEKKQVA